jgi:hypothetical protein
MCVIYQFILGFWKDPSGVEWVFRILFPSQGKDCSDEETDILTHKEFFEGIRLCENLKKKNSSKEEFGNIASPEKKEDKATVRDIETRINKCVYMRYVLDIIFQYFHCFMSYAY